MRLDGGGLSLLHDADLVTRGNEAPNMEVEPERGDTGGEEVTVDVSEDSEDPGGNFCVLAKETVLVPDLDHEKNVWVLSFEVKNLLFKRRVCRVLWKGFGGGSRGGGGGRGGREVKELGKEAAVEERVGGRNGGGGLRGGGCRFLGFGGRRRG